MRLPDGATIDDEGVWNQVFTTPEPGRSALFLDRDGVIVEEVHYLHRVDDTRIIPGAPAVIARANQRGIPVVVVTNQAGVGRGIFDWPAFADVQELILEQLAAAGAYVDAVYACPHHRHAEAPWTHPDHPARKPNPGMLLRAAAVLSVDLASSWIIGDRAGDVEAGRRAGIQGGLHVFTGHGSTDGERDLALALATGAYSVAGIASIADAPANIPFLG